MKESENRIFISYALQDIHHARKIRDGLKEAGYQTWLEEDDLLAGQGRDVTVRKAICASRFFLVLLSGHSVSRGPANLQVAQALKIIDEFPQGDIFVIPARLEPCEPSHEEIVKRQIVNLFPDRDSGFRKILAALAFASGSPPCPVVKMASDEILSPDCLMDRAEKMPEHPPAPDAAKRNLIRPGGALDPQSRFYVHRRADAEVLEEVLQPRAVVIVRGPRQTGKTSLLHHAYLHFQNSRELQPVIVDFQAMGTGRLHSADRVWASVADEIARQLGFTLWNPDQWDAGAGYAANFTDFLQNTIFPDTDVPLLLCLDEADRIFASEFSSDFFSAIRAFFNRGSFDPLWKKVRWIICSSSEPRFFIRNLNESPFNIGLDVRLDSFTEEETAFFARCHGLDLPEPDLGKIREYLGGRPFLVHLLFFHMARSPANQWSAFMDGSSAGNGIFLRHLNRYLEQFQQEKDLARAMRQVLAGKGCPDVRMADRLGAAGLVRYDNGMNLRCACGLYARYFREKIK